MDEVSEDQCLICRRWPAAERTDQRWQHFFKQGLLLIPVHDMCPACERVWAMKTARKH
jgi:hypothetical protein